MITNIENALVERLQLGLGKMVRVVKSYGGELEDERWSNAIHVLPAVWVTYRGAKISALNTLRQRYQQTATFVVICATSNLASEQVARQGAEQEIGSNDLVYAVLRLLSGQRLDDRLHSFGLVPKSIRTVRRNVVVQSGALNVVAIEFEATWDFTALENDRYPEHTDDTHHPDWIFTHYQGKLSDPYTNLNGVHSYIYDPGSNAKIDHDITLNSEV